MIYFSVYKQFEKWNSDFVCPALDKPAGDVVRVMTMSAFPRFLSLLQRFGRHLRQILCILNLPQARLGSYIYMYKKSEVFTSVTFLKIKTNSVVFCFVFDSAYTSF